MHHHIIIKKRNNGKTEYDKNLDTNTISKVSQQIIEKE